MNFVLKLTSLMERTKVKQPELSRRTGLSQSTISRYLAGKTEPTVSELLLIANALGVVPSVFFEQDSSSLITNDMPSTIEINGWKVRALSAEQKLESLKAAIQALIERY